MSEEQQQQTITLPSSGSIPGIPGDHAPGTYLVDYATRTITPVHPPTETEEQLQAEVAQLQEELTTLTQPQEAN